MIRLSAVEVGMKMIAVLSAFALAACGEAQPEPDAGEEDAGRIAEDDAGPIDLDAGPDAGPDAGCVCTGATECCDGCMPINEGATCDSPRPGTGGDTGTCLGGRCEGAPCECSSGPCCDGCLYRPTDYVCERDRIYATRCVPTGITACPGYSPSIEESFGNVHCPGDASTCTGEIEHVRHGGHSCWTMENPIYCVEDSPEPLAAHCAHACAP